MNLALKYRPKEFADLVGQDAVSIVLQAMIAKKALQSALLFTGPSGVGKTTMARIIAAQLNSEGATEVHEGLHPSVLEIDAASNGSVEALRQLKRDLNFTAVGHRVVILDECHAISYEGKTVLLNMLEFPPDNVTFILLTTEAHKIPVQVRHRCDTYHFKRATVADLVKRLAVVAEKEGITIENELLLLLAQQSDGSFRESLMLLNQVWVADITTVSAYYALNGNADFGPELLDSALSGAVKALDKLNSVLSYLPAEDIIDRTVAVLRDLMLVKAGVGLEFTGNALEYRQQLASKLPTEKILKAIRIMWDVQTKMSNADATRSLEMAYALLGDALHVQDSPTIESSTAPMTFAQMQARRI